MGLYAGFDPETLNAEELRATMLEAMRPWFTAHIQIHDPGLATQTTYDPLTDTGGAGSDTLLWDSGPAGALVQPLIRVLDREVGGQEQGYRQVRIQTALPPEVHLRAGLRVKVIDGGNNPNLEDFSYLVEEGIDSSLAWGAIITCTVVM